ncbi:MAG: hypothetical protein L6420_09035 [Elusimicrobia bacterium]|nr:hypothetical protein [Elusimicrobiota bacterium]
MKHSKEKILLKSNLREYPLDNIRYAAYSVTDEAYVLLKKLSSKIIEVSLKQKGRNSVKKTAMRFTEELKNEKIRADIFKNNSELREFLILKALSYEEKSQPQAEDAGLTPEQEKELDELISQVEKEIKKESSDCKKQDPLKINQTWEEKYAGKNKKNKK